MSVDDIPCLPKHFFQHYAKLTHGFGSCVKSGYDNADEEIMVYKGVTVFAENFCKRCVTCKHTQ